METSKKYNNTKGLLLHLCKQRDYKGIVNLAVESSFSKLDDEAYSLTLEAFCSDPRGTGLGSHFNELLEQASERVRNSESKSFKYRILLLILNLYGTGTIRLFSDKELTSFLSKLQLEHELRCLVNLYIEPFEHTFKNDIHSYLNAMKEIIKTSRQLITNNQGNSSDTPFASTCLRRASNFSITTTTQELIKSSSLHELLYFDPSKARPQMASKFTVLISLEEDYFSIFYPRLFSLAHAEPYVSFIVLLLKSNSRTCQNSVHYSTCLLPNINITTVNLDTQNNTQLHKTMSCCLKYILLPSFLMQEEDGILLLDVDLMLDNIALDRLIEKLIIDQDWLPNHVQTFKTSSNDFQSCISAGFLFAAKRHLEAFATTSSYIQTCFRYDHWNWGLDPAAIIYSMGRHNLLPIKAPVLEDLPPSSEVFFVTPYEQQLKSQNRTV